MALIYVARSIKLSKWASDAGLGKHVFKLGLTSEAAKPLVAAANWAGESDWALLKTAEAAAGSIEAAMIEALAARLRRIDPQLYPKLRGERGIFRLTLQQAENHLLITRALADEAASLEIKIRPVDFAVYLLYLAQTTPAIAQTTPALAQITMEREQGA